MTRTSSVKAAFKKAAALLEFCGLSEKSQERAGNLPTISQRRLELAKALGTSPEVILLDEIMAGLNITECDQAMDLVRKICSNGVTILMVEHVMRAVMALCGRIIVLNRGKVLSEGEPKKIVNDPLVIKAYLGEGVSNASGS